MSDTNLAPAEQQGNRENRPGQWQVCDVDSLPPARRRNDGFYRRLIEAVAALPDSKAIIFDAKGRTATVRANAYIAASKVGMRVSVRCLGEEKYAIAKAEKGGAA